VTAALKLPAEPKTTARDVRRGMWLEGFEEREKGVLGGWVEAGGALVGIKVALDGKVTAGEVREDATGSIVAGRFGFSRGSGRSAETTDGGFTWKDVEVPDRDDASVNATATRACGPAGCALGGWIRVGWGKPALAADLAQADAPKVVYPRVKDLTSMPLVCEADASVTAPIATKAAPKPEPPPSRPPRPRFATPPPRLHAHPHAGVATMTLTPWAPFRNGPPPALGADETGVDNGALSDPVQLRAYAWGKKGADWTRAGRWLIRFDDRFDGAGGVRSSAASASPWPDEATAADAIGVGTYGSTQWFTSNDSRGTLLDPSGRSILASGCRQSQCALYAVSDGQPVLSVRDATGRAAVFARPTTAVRLGETWFFLTQASPNDAVVLWRAELGVARQVATYFRPSQARSAALAPILVRRHQGSAVGILFVGQPEPWERLGAFHVMPLNADTGALGDAIPIGRVDFGGKLPERCTKNHDGWVFDTPASVSAPIAFTNGAASAEGLELRVRMDPGAVCVDSMSARLEGTFSKGRPAASSPASLPKSGRPDDAAPIPLAATERSGRRWAMRCARSNAK
jgi:hypothetical protein